MGMTRCPICGELLLAESRIDEKRCLNMSCMARVYNDGSTSRLIFENDKAKEIRTYPDRHTEVVREWRYRRA